MAETLFELGIDGAILQVGIRLGLIDARPLRQRPQTGDRVPRVDVHGLVVLPRAVVDRVDVDRELTRQPLGDAEVDLVRGRLLEIVRRDLDVGRRGRDERQRGLALIRIRVGGSRDAHGELLQVPELAQVRQHPDVAVVQPPPGPHHGGAVAENVPRDTGSRPEVVLVAARRHVDVGNRHRKHRRVQILVGVAVEALVAEAEVQRDIRSDLPIVLHEADVVLRRMLGGDGRKTRGERRGAGQPGDRRRIVRIERLILGEGVGAGSVADGVVLVLHQADIGAELHLVRTSAQGVGVLELIAAFRAHLIVAAAVGHRREAIRT